jgi:hypothetical protein
VLQNLVKHAILVPHDVGPFRVPKAGQAFVAQKNQRHALCRQKLNRTSPAMTVFFCDGPKKSSRAAMILPVRADFDLVESEKDSQMG